MSKQCGLYPACDKRSYLVCTGCRITRYCFKVHQNLHWNVHHLSCSVDKENWDTIQRGKPHVPIQSLRPVTLLGSLLNESAPSSISLSPDIKEATSYLAKPNIWHALTPSAERTTNFKRDNVDVGSSLQHTSSTAHINSAGIGKITPMIAKPACSGGLFTRESPLPIYNETILNLGFIKTPSTLSKPFVTKLCASLDSGASSGPLPAAAPSGDDVNVESDWPITSSSPSSYRQLSSFGSSRARLPEIVFEDTGIGYVTRGRITVDNMGGSDQAVYEKNVTGPFRMNWKRKRGILKKDCAIRIPLVFEPLVAGTQFGMLTLAIENSTEVLLIPVKGDADAV